MEHEYLFETEISDTEVVTAAFVGENEDDVFAYDHVTHEEISEWAIRLLKHFDQYDDPESVEKASSSHGWGKIVDRGGEDYLDLKANKSDVGAFPYTVLRLW